LIAQFPEALAFGDLSPRFSFSQTGGRGKRFGDGFALHFAREPIVGTVAGIGVPMATTV